MININHGIYHMGERAKDVYSLVKIISKNKNRKNSQDYENSVDELIRYYDFNLFNDEWMDVDLLLEKNLVLEKVTINRDMLIAFARAGIVAIQRKENMNVN